MTYVVCQTPKCQQTYPLQDFEPKSVNVSCEKCGGILIDGDGHANLSQHATIIPVITPEEIEYDRQMKLAGKREQLATLQSEIDVLEDTAETEPKISCYDCRFFNAEQSICDRNYRAYCIRDEEKSAKERPYYTEGEFIDSDENLLVD